MIYRLGRYMYKNYTVYKTWGPFKWKVAEGLSYREGVIEVNRLNGIIESEPDYSHLIPLEPEKLTNNLSGKFLVNFKEPEGFFGNDPWPAKITPYKGRLLVEWTNGRDAVIGIEHLNIWYIPVLQKREKEHK